MLKVLRRVGASGATASLVLVVLLACNSTATVTASPSPSARPSASAAPTTAPTATPAPAASAAPANVALKSFAFTDGAVFSAALAGKATTLSFLAGATSFTLSGADGTASGGNAFGSCILTIIWSTYPASFADLQLGKTITLNPCELRANGTLIIHNRTVNGTSSVAVAVVATPTPAPTVAAPAPATAAPTPVRTNAPAPTVAPPPVATIAPTPIPAPTAAPAAGYPGGISSSSGPTIPGFTRYNGKVTDSVTGAPLAGVCVYAGPPVDCPKPNLNTDAAGNWAIDFPSGVTWQFNFQHPLYTPKLQLTGTTINVQLVKK